MISWDADARRNHEDGSVTEDDILHASKLPTFGDSLIEGDSEALLSFLCVPSMRASLVLKFLSDESRIKCLQNEDILKIVWSAIFCVGDWPVENRAIDAKTGVASAPESISQIPVMGKDRLGSRLSLLFVELRCSPASILDSTYKMVNNTLQTVIFAEFTTPNTTGFFFCVRLAVAIVDHAVYIYKNSNSSDDNDNNDISWNIDGFSNKLSASTKAQLVEKTDALRFLLTKHVIPLLQRWSEEAFKVVSGFEVEDNADDILSESKAEKKKRMVLRHNKATEILKHVSSHKILLLSPAVLNNMALYTNDDLGTEMIGDYLASVAYVTEWYVREYVEYVDMGFLFRVKRYGCISVLLLSYYIFSGALGSPDLLLPYSMITLESHIT